MKLSISEVRKRLPALIRQVRTGTDASVLITVHNDVVAELRAAQPEPRPGAAAQKLMAVMKNLPRHREKKTAVSTNVKTHLYRSRSSKLSWHFRAACFAIRPSFMPALIPGA